MWGLSPQDNNSSIESYMSSYGITNPCAGTQGGGSAAIDIITSGQNFLGYPTYCVTCPDQTMHFDVNWPPTATGFDSYIAGCPGVSIDELENMNKSLITKVYPSPASVSTNIEIYVNEVSDITIDLYNILGEKVYSTDFENINTGEHNIELPLNDLNSGSYFINMLVNDNLTDVSKLLIVK